ncbi:hypothetical protein E2320_001493 [Naja naja]|nr:hypothetical protein E2320_001493 [Naja naja]
MGAQDRPQCFFDIEINREPENVIFCKMESVHVVFGLVISGFEVIEQIENLKTDSASRPYADVRVIDCGVLVTKSAKKGTK